MTQKIPGYKLTGAKSGYSVTVFFVPFDRLLHFKVYQEDGGKVGCEAYGGEMTYAVLGYNGGYIEQISLAKPPEEVECVKEAFLQHLRETAPDCNMLTA